MAGKAGTLGVSCLYWGHSGAGERLGDPGLCLQQGLLSEQWLQTRADSRLFLSGQFPGGGTGWLGNFPFRALLSLLQNPWKLSFRGSQRDLSFAQDTARGVGAPRLPYLLPYFWAWRARRREGRARRREGLRAGSTTSPQPWAEAKAPAVRVRVHRPKARAGGRWPHRTVGWEGPDPPVEVS